MKKYLLPTILLASTLTFAGAQTIYLTGQGNAIRRSTDNGATFADWVTGGNNFAGMALDGSNNLLVFDRGTALRLYAVNPTVGNSTNIASAQIANATVSTGGTFATRPVAFFNGRAYVNANGLYPGNNTAFFTWDGTSFGTQTNSLEGTNWTSDDFIFASAGGVDYAFQSGSGSSGVRRWQVAGNGTFTAVTMNVTFGWTDTVRDFLFTPSGRWLVLTNTGIYYSAPGSISSTSLTLNSLITFTGTENPSLGDMGGNGRDMYLFGNTLYAVSNTQLYQWSFDDSTLSTSFLGNVTHGLSSDNLHLIVIPEPATWFLIGSGLSLFTIFRKRRRVALT